MKYDFSDVLYTNQRIYAGYCFQYVIYILKKKASTNNGEKRRALTSRGENIKALMMPMILPYYYNFIQ